MRTESDLLEIREEAEKQVTLPAGGTLGGGLPLVAAPRAGKASFALRDGERGAAGDGGGRPGGETRRVWEAVTIVGMTEDSVQEGLAVPARFLGVPEEGLRWPWTPPSPPA